MKKFLKEFKDFALRGNVMELAVGIMIATAFGGIVTSLTENLISPIIGIFAHQNFDNLVLSLFDGKLVLKYGAFITSVIGFFITALVVFLLVKLMKKLASIGSKAAGAKKQEAAPITKTCPFCKTEIHIEATRCPNCTSELNPKESA
jgi:large conductance mechanosensitive channel